MERKNQMNCQALALFFLLAAAPPYGLSAGASGKNILVNGKPFVIRGAAYTLSYPECNHFTQIPAEVYEKDLRLMKKAGINTLRTYDVPPPFFLDLVEKHGLKIIVQVDYVGYWTKYDSEKERKALIDEAVSHVKANKHRKCILMWAIWNDAPFVYNAASRDVVDEFGFDKVNGFLKAIYDAVKKEDPDRPVTGSNMLNFNGSSLGFDFLDVISFNAYFGITDWERGKFDRANALDMVEQIKNITASREKPVLISETGYSTFHAGTDQGMVIREQISVIGTNFAGIVVFQWADDWGKAGDHRVLNNHIEEHWGILDGYRNPKSGYQAVRKLWSKGGKK